MSPARDADDFDLLKGERDLLQVTRILGTRRLIVGQCLPDRGDRRVRQLNRVVENLRSRNICYEELEENRRQTLVRINCLIELRRRGAPLFTEDDRLMLPGVVSHATNVVEHAELVAERILRFANLVGRERVIASTDCGLGGRVHPQIAWAKLETLATETGGLALRARDDV